MTGDMFGSRSAHSRQSGQGAPSGSGGSAASSVPAVDTSSSTTALSELVTTYSSELNVASDGTARVNVKTASQTDMTTALGAQIASKIISARTQNASSWNSIADLLGNPLSKTDMQTVGDKIIVADAQYREGVININTAPAEVLATIPGVDATVYNAIIQARQSGTVFTGLNDLFQLNLSRTQFVALVDHVCTKSSVYLVRVRVRIPGSQKIYAVQALIRLTPPQQQTQTAANGQTTTPPTTGASTLQPAVLYQFREVPRRPGWTNWAPAPNFYQSGGTVGIP
jgi:DNA uptake protein ComE-like DNA-binding protein